eukprot:544367_1
MQIANYNHKKSNINSPEIKAIWFCLLHHPLRPLLGCRCEHVPFCRVHACITGDGSHAILIGLSSRKCSLSTCHYLSAPLCITVQPYVPHNNSPCVLEPLSAA